MQVTLGGVEEFKLKLQEAAVRVKANVDAAVAECGDELLAETIPLTPMAIDGGRLRRSGYVDRSRPGVVSVGFSASYALYVHEMGITVYPERAPIHWTTPGTGAKFLERAWVANEQRFAEKIMDAARDGLE